MTKQRVIYLIGIITLIILVGYVAGAAVNTVERKSLTATQARDLIAKHQNDDNFIILDVRTPSEFASGHIAGAVLLDYYNPGFKNAFAKLDKSKTYLIYCRSGNRSGKTLDLASKQGFDHVYHMGSGIREWQSKGYPLVR